jgi:hypothetical protein
MPTLKDVAKFFQLALRLRLVDAAAVERWAEAQAQILPKVDYPLTELCRASALPATRLDALLGEVPGTPGEHVPGRLVLALVGRRWRENQLSPGVAIRIAYHVACLGALSDEERSRASGLDDTLQLAASGTYGDESTVRSAALAFFEHYSEYEPHLPPSA